MSVTAWTVKSISFSAAYLFKCPMHSVTWVYSSSWGVTIPPFRAVFRIPAPNGFVRTKTSPGFAEEFFQTLSGCTIPSTDKPYFGSSSSTVWPPTSRHSASFILSAPPRRISVSTHGSRQLGKQTIFMAVSGTPPIAYTSDKEFAAAIAPKVYGSSTMGVKKSSVWTIARESSI